MRPRVLGKAARVGCRQTGLVAEDIRNYMMKWCSPDRMALVGIDCDHETLSKWAMRSFVDHNAILPANIPEEKPQYTGGQHQMESDSCWFSNMIKKLLKITYF